MTKRSARLRLIDCMELEDRTLPSATPMGVEVLVNTTTANVQETSVESQPAVASDATGNYVAVWSSDAQDGDGWGVFAQRFSVEGTPQGSEFQVNLTTANDQQFAAVAMDATETSLSHGRITTAPLAREEFALARITQAVSRRGASGRLIDAHRRAKVFIHRDERRRRLRRYLVELESRWQRMGSLRSAVNSAGVAVGAEFQVNSTTAADQLFSRVAIDASGDFVITWQSSGQDGDGWGVYGQRFDSVGAAQGDEFQVHQTAAGDQTREALRWTAWAISQ